MQGAVATDGGRLAAAPLADADPAGVAPLRLSPRSVHSVEDVLRRTGILTPEAEARAQRPLQLVSTQRSGNNVPDAIQVRVLACVREAGCE